MDMKAQKIRKHLPRHRQLRALRVRNPTLVKYEEAVVAFEKYARRRRMVLNNLSKTDKALAEYCVDLYEDGEPYNMASYALFGFLVLRVDSDVPEKSLLPRTRMALKGWTSVSPLSSRTGADATLWYLFADIISEASAPAAAALLLQLDTYARPSEILGLTLADVIQPSSKQCKYWGVIFGNSEAGSITKTGTQDDTVLLDSIDRSYAPQVLKMVASRCTSPSSQLFPGVNLDLYERHFRNTKSQLKLGKFELTPHSVRHSGPSLDSLSKARDPSAIQSRGRWRTQKSILRYQKPGQMLAKMAKVPQTVWDDASAALPRVLQKLTHFYGDPHH